MESNLKDPFQTKEVTKLKYFKYTNPVEVDDHIFY